MAAKRLWDKGYDVDEAIEEFTVGNDYVIDMSLVEYDCLASVAHARMLGTIGILKKAEVKKLVDELDRIILLWKHGKFRISKDEEDVHTAIENELTRRLGALGKKIHTGRSRNDQVLTALRLYYKANLQRCIGLADDYVKALSAFSSKYGRIKLPGYTHTRKAMPSSIAMWSEAFSDSMRDNIVLMKAALSLVDQSPLGTGAGYGSPIRLDRTMTAAMLGFSKVQRNPIYVQMSRGKFEATILHALSQVMFDLNRLSTDLILFTIPELGYFELPREFTTGSSMMPQKRNPDVLELLRAKYHLMVSYEMQVKGIAANLPTGYNRDMQLTKEPVMLGFSLAQQSLAVTSRLLKGLGVNRENCAKGLTEEVYATQRAYELVMKGMPFRDAYKEAAKDYAKS